MSKEEEKEPTFEEQLAKMIAQATKPLREEYEEQVKTMKEKTEKLSNEVQAKLEKILAQMQVYHCYVCNKDLVSGKDAIYTNFKGHKFCSHDCIDKQEVSNDN